MQWFGRPVNFNRFLGQVDQDDPTNLPVGLAAVCLNTDFTRDSPGVTCAGTRAGFNRAMQGVAQAAITGASFFVFSPQLPGQARFEMPVAFDYAGNLQREVPVGSGRMVKIPAGPLFTPPAATHMLGASAGNKLWMAFSDLKVAAGGWACLDPNAVQTGVGQPLNPAGMKPVGWYWQPNTAVAVGEYCCPAAPATGNGHTYRCVQAGVTAAAVGAGYFPTDEGAQFDDGTAKWQEATMVMANRLPAPPAPALALSGGGAFPDNQTVWLLLTFVNGMGETVAGAVASVTTTAAAQLVQATLPTLADLPGWLSQLIAPYAITGVNVYEADAASGSPLPPLSTFERVAGGPFALGTVVPVTTTAATGLYPSGANTARITPGQLPTPTALVDIERDPLAGTFPAGRDVYVLQTYTNSAGETPGGPPNLIGNTVADDGVQVTVAVPEDDAGNALYVIASVGIYEADVPTGTPAPSMNAYRLVGYYQAGASFVIAETATGAGVPTVNSTGPGGAIAADTSTGGVNGGQGYRYAACLFMNQNGTVSGFTPASAISYDVDEDGWELAFFNIPTGPANIVARLVAPTGADESQDGPFNWIGVVDLLVPSQNVVYPMTTPSGTINETATALFDNVTTKAVFNFDDTFLANSNNVDDRTDVLAPFEPCRVDYLKTVDSLAFTGVQGYTGGALLSIPGDYESVYADQGAIPFPSDGQRCFGVTDAYKGVIFALRESGGYAIEPNTGNPATWTPIQRWSEVGPCGFRAWDATGKLIAFVHRSGLYIYNEADPQLLSKEVPRRWSTINWNYAHLIAVTIDEDTRTIRIQVPTGASARPNQEFVLSYLEGWQDPIHFSTFSGKEISMDQARRWSFNDLSAFFSTRMNRTLPPGPAFLDGPDWSTMPDAAFGVSQLLFGSSADDGTVQARTPGVYNDNGAGINWQYETVCAGMMQAVCKPEGLNLNCSGSGLISVAFLAARDQLNGPGGPRAVGVWMEDIVLDPAQKIGITRKCEPVIDEYWRVHFDNGKQPDAWCSLKAMNVYLIPFTGGRGEWEGN